MALVLARTQFRFPFLMSFLNFSVETLNVTTNFIKLSKVYIRIEYYILIKRHIITSMEPKLIVRKSFKELCL